MTTLGVSELARRAGVHPQTIRFYERRGLLPEPPRTSSNYRAYSEDDVLRVRFVRRAKDLGFTLREIEELLALRSASGAGRGDVRARATSKVRDIDRKVETLLAMRRELARLVGECSPSGSLADCPILDALDATTERADGPTLVPRAGSTRVRTTRSMEGRR